MKKKLFLVRVCNRVCEKQFSIRFFAFAALLFYSGTALAQSTYSFTREAYPGGTIASGSTPNGSYPAGTSITVIAKADVGHKFIGWMNNASRKIDDIGGTYLTKMPSKDLSLTALFMKLPEQGGEGGEGGQGGQGDDCIPFDEIGVVMYNNVLMIKNIALETIADIKWFRDDEVIGTELYYSAGDKDSDLLDENAEYRVEITTTDGRILRTCPQRMPHDQGGQGDDCIPFDQIGEVMYNNVLMITNINPETITDVKWFKNDEVIGTELYYSAGDKHDEELDKNAKYHVEITTIDGRFLRTCPQRMTLTSLSTNFPSPLQAYPNPVNKGSLITIEGIPQEVGSVIIYDIAGRVAARHDLTAIRNESETIPMPAIGGIYLIKVGKKTIKIVVK